MFPDQLYHEKQKGEYSGTTAGRGSCEGILEATDPLRDTIFGDFLGHWFARLSLGTPMDTQIVRPARGHAGGRKAHQKVSYDA